MIDFVSYLQPETSPNQVTKLGFAGITRRANHTTRPSGRKCAQQFLTAFSYTPILTVLGYLFNLYHILFVSFIPIFTYAMYIITVYTKVLG